MRNRWHRLQRFYAEHNVNINHVALEASALPAPPATDDSQCQSVAPSEPGTPLAAGDAMASFEELLSNSEGPTMKLKSAPATDLLDATLLGETAGDIAALDIMDEMEMQDAKAEPPGDDKAGVSIP